MNRFVIMTLVALPLAAGVPAMAQHSGSAAPPSTSAQGNAAISLTPDQIRQLQQALNDHGFEAGEVDGVFNERTSTALKRFQSKAGLPPTGQVDEQLLALVGLSGQARQPAGADPSTGQGGQSSPPDNPTPPRDQTPGQQR